MAVLVLLISAPAALADGDPASDVLPAADVFASAPSPALVAAVKGANAGGNRVKVAVIASAYDLGSVPSLFGKPAQYARFLGIELGTVYSGVLVVVMPKGVGVYDHGRPVAAEEKAVAGLHGPPADVAAAAVQRLAAAKLLHYTDVLAPLVYALGGLQYAVLDDSGRAAVTVTLYAGKKAVGTFHRRLGPVNPAGLYTATFASRGTRYCVVATDAAGNRSAPACSKT